MATRPRPPKAPSAPENGVAASPHIFGQISEEANQNIQNMRLRTHNLIGELGRLEVRKFQLVQSIQQMEAQTQAILKLESQKLGIPEGLPWELTPEGTALGAGD